MNASLLTYSNRLFNPVLSLSSLVWKFSAGMRGTIVVYFVLSVAALTTSLCEPIIISSALSRLAAATPDQIPHIILHATALFFILRVLFLVTHFPSRLLERRVAFRIRQSFQVYLLSSITSMSSRWHKENHSGDIIDRIQKGVSALYRFADDSYILIHLTGTLAGALIALTIYFPLVGIAAATFTAITMIGVMTFDRFLIPALVHVNSAFHKLSSRIHDTLSNIQTVLALRLEGNTVRNVADEMQQIEPFQWRCI